MLSTFAESTNNPLEMLSTFAESIFKDLDRLSAKRKRGKWSCFGFSAHHFNKKTLTFL
jgi:hypothetical protein